MTKKNFFTERQQASLELVHLKKAKLKTIQIFFAFAKLRFFPYFTATVIRNDAKHSSNLAGLFWGASGITFWLKYHIKNDIYYVVIIQSQRYDYSSTQYYTFFPFFCRCVQKIWQCYGQQRAFFFILWDSQQEKRPEQLQQRRSLTSFQEVQENI